MPSPELPKLVDLFVSRMTAIGLRLRASWARYMAELMVGIPREEWKLRYRAERLERRAKAVEDSVN